jgi:hypothetical protein
MIIAHRVIIRYQDRRLILTEVGPTEQESVQGSGSPPPPFDHRRPDIAVVASSSPLSQRFVEPH